MGGLKTAGVASPVEIFWRCFMKNRKKWNKLFLSGMLGMALAFGLVVAGCDNGSTGGGSDPKTIVISGITNEQMSAAKSSSIGVFPAGTSLDDAIANTGIVAGASSTDDDFSYTTSPNTATFPLWTAPFPSYTRWTGDGTYDVYFATFSGSSPTGTPNGAYKKTGVSINAASITLDASTFESVLD
jgi:hypothetical protein